MLLSQQPRGFFKDFVLHGQFTDDFLQIVGRLSRLISLGSGLLLGIAFVLEDISCIGLKLFSPTVQHGAGGKCPQMWLLTTSDTGGEVEKLIYPAGFMSR